RRHGRVHGSPRRRVAGDHLMLQRVVPRPGHGEEGAANKRWHHRVGGQDPPEAGGDRHGHGHRGPFNPSRPFHPHTAVVAITLAAMLLLSVTDVVYTLHTMNERNSPPRVLRERLEEAIRRSGLGKSAFAARAG